MIRILLALAGIIFIPAVLGAIAACIVSGQITREEERREWEHE